MEKPEIEEKKKLLFREAIGAQRSNYESRKDKVTESVDQVISAVAPNMYFFYHVFAKIELFHLTH